MINEEIKEQTGKLKNMDLKQKISYIWDYYKVHIMIAVVVIFAVSSFIHDKATSKDCVFFVAMLNSNVSSAVESDLFNDFAASLEDFDPEHETMTIDANYNIEGTDQVAYAFMQRILADYNVGNIDATIATRDAIEQFASYQAYADLKEILPADLFNDLEAAGWDFIYNTYEDPATGKTYTYPAAVNISSCPAIKKGFTDAEGINVPYFDTECYYAISPNSLHTDTAVAFLSFLFSM